MLDEARIEILYNALYITINSKKFQEYTKKINLNLYEKISKSVKKHNTTILSTEQIKQMITENGLGTIEEIITMQNKFSETEKPGIIGKFNDYIRMMVKHYDATHEVEQDVQDLDSLWMRRQRKN